MNNLDSVDSSAGKIRFGFNFLKTYFTSMSKNIQDLVEEIC